MRISIVSFLAILAGCAGFTSASLPVDPKVDASDSGIARFSCENQLERSVPLAVLCEGCELSLTESQSIPREADERLQLHSPSGGKIVRSPEDLRGHVQIDSIASALEYLQLFSSECTFHLFTTMQLGVERSNADACIVPCLPDDRWETLGLFAPRATEKDGFIEVERFVVVPIPNLLHVSLRRVVDKVYPDGQVVRESSQTVEITLADQARLRFPLFM